MASVLTILCIASSHTITKTKTQYLFYSLTHNEKFTPPSSHSNQYSSFPFIIPKHYLLTNILIYNALLTHNSLTYKLKQQDYYNPKSIFPIHIYISVICRQFSSLFFVYHSNHNHFSISPILNLAEFLRKLHSMS